MRRWCSTSPASPSTPTTAAAWQHPLTGGLILFARNWRDRRQLTELVAEIKALRPDVLVCVDHEGGRVQRFRSDGFTAAAADARARRDVDGRRPRRPGSGAMRALEAATAAGHVLGAELRACGVDLSFTPVLDLDHGGSGVIGDRAFHRDPRVVAAARQEPDARPARRPACATAASTSRGTASSRPTATSRCRSTAARSPPSWPTMPRPYEWLAGSLSQRDAGARRLSQGRRAARPASRSAGCKEILRLAARLRRRDLQRRPEHGRRAPHRRASRSATPRRRRSRSRPAATWCCSATSRSTAAPRSTSCSTACCGPRPTATGSPIR